MKIHGFQKTTLLDFPEKVACTVFTGGCNYRCPFCHNAPLVLHPDDAPLFDEVPREGVLRPDASGIVSARAAKVTAAAAAAKRILISWFLGGVSAGAERGRLRVNNRTISYTIPRPETKSKLFSGKNLISGKTRVD